MSYDTILVGSDGSDTAAIAVDKAAQLAKRFNAKLLIGTASKPVGMIDTVAEELASSIAEQVGRKHEVACEPAVKEGEPGEALAGLAKDLEVDLIVVGSLGMGKARRLRLGGIAERAAVHAPCDVLIVDTTTPEEEHERVWGRLLVGTDGSPTATAAVIRAYDLGMMLGVGVLVVSVTDDELIGAINLESALKLKHRALGVETRLLKGDPAKRLIETAEQEDIGIVMVGNRGLTGKARLMGSVPLKVAHEATTDVLVIRTVGRTIEDLAPGQGAIVNVNGRELAAFKDPDGRVSLLNPRCQHMGCTVGWNQAEKTWDCPCHGSRYDTAGEVIQGPAKKALDPAEGAS